ncbi:hypothetical protein [Mesorhizobium sp. M1272]|uniref:hypothetical protein n=1 Tax=Mesorhizobium sp. M1272 TaxID=2957074 RepID=UPI00333D8005
MLIDFSARRDAASDFLRQMTFPKSLRQNPPTLLSSKRMSSAASPVRQFASVWRFDDTGLLVGLVTLSEIGRPRAAAAESCGRSSHGLPFGDGLQAMNMYGESRTFGAGDEEVAEG